MWGTKKIITKKINMANLRISTEISVLAGEGSKIPLNAFYQAETKLEIKFDSFQSLLCLSLNLTRSSEFMGTLASLASHMSEDLDLCTFASALETITGLSAMIQESIAFGSFIDYSGVAPIQFDVIGWNGRVK